MKAIVLTYAPVYDLEQKILKNTKIFKLALNQHAADLKPDARIITDYVLQNILKTCSEKIISVREKLRCYSPRLESPDIEFKGSTIIAALDYLISKNFDEILIVGDNSVNRVQFRNEVNDNIDKIRHKANIYQYTNGNFKLGVKTIKEFVR
jgi:hypothetical protein